jgi:hypothetical protein
LQNLKTMLEIDDSRHLILLRASTHTRARTYTHTHTTHTLLFRVKLSNTSYMKTMEDRGRLTQQEQKTFTSEDPLHLPTDPYQ